jgi:hypothetical protein
VTGSRRLGAGKDVLFAQDVLGGEGAVMDPACWAALGALRAASCTPSSGSTKVLRGAFEQRAVARADRCGAADGGARRGCRSSASSPRRPLFEEGTSRQANGRAADLQLAYAHLSCGATQSETGAAPEQVRRRAQRAPQALLRSLAGRQG